MAADEKTIDTPCDEYEEMADKWRLPMRLCGLDDCGKDIGGTEAMRAEYVKQFEEEAEEDFAYRRENSVLFPMFKMSVARLVDRPFSKLISLKAGADGDAKLPERLQRIEENADGLGTSLTSFKAKQFEDKLTYGLTHTLVDMPSGVAALGRERSLEAAISPYFTAIPARSLIYWDRANVSIDEIVRRMNLDPAAPGYLTRPQAIAILSGSRSYLSEIRYRTTGSEIVDGEKKRVRFVWQWTPTEIVRWRQIDDKDGNAVVKRFVAEEGVKNELGKIPLVTDYANRTGYMTASPPMLGLADTNLAHFLSESDQGNILHKSRIPMFFQRMVSGGKESESKVKNFVLAAGRRILGRDQHDDAKWVETSGNGAKAGAERATVLESRAEVQGMQPFYERIGNQTATSRVISDGDTGSAIQRWIRDTEGAVVDEYTLAAEWIEEKLPAEFKADIHSEFHVPLYGQTSDDIIKFEAAGIIDRETAYEEGQRRGILQESRSYEVVAERLLSEPPDGAGGDGGGEFSREETEPEVEEAAA